MKAYFSALSVAVAVGVTGCAGAAVPGGPPAPLPPPAEAPRAAAPLPDLSPAAAPAHLEIAARVAHPSRLLKALLPMVGPSVQNVLGGADWSSIAEMILGEPVGPIVDLDRPLYAVWVGAPGEEVRHTAANFGDGDFAVSAELVAGGAALESLARYFTFAADDPSVQALTARIEKKTALPCAVAPAFGTGRRLVCGSNIHALQVLLPYLTRTMTRADQSLDLSVEVFPEELREKDEGSDAREYRFFKTLWTRTFRQLWQDVDKLTLEGSSDEGRLDARLTVRFKAGDSPPVRAILGEARGSGDLPAAFDRLPLTTGMVAYGRGATAADLLPAQATFAAGLRASLAQDGYDSAGSDYYLSWLDRLFLTGGPWVIARAPRFDAARAALEAVRPEGKVPAALRATARAAMRGSVLLAVQEPTEKWIEGLKKLLTEDPKRTDRRLPRKTRSVTSVAPVPAALHLGKGTLHLVNSETPNPAWRAPKGSQSEPATAHTTHVLVAADGDWTWVGLGDDLTALASDIKVALSRPADGAGTFKARQDVDALRAERGGGGAVVSLAELAELFAGDGSDEELRESRRKLDKLRGIPAVATTPVVLSLAAPTTEDRGPSPAVILHVRIPALSDVLVGALPTIFDSNHHHADDDEGPDIEDGAKGAPRVAIVDGVEVIEHGVFTTRASKSDVNAPDTALGTISSLGQGYPTLVHAGSVVPMELGTLFGFGCVARGAPQGRLIGTRVRVTHPPTTNPATGVPNTVDEWDWGLNIGLVSFSGWSFDKPWAMVAGKWKLEVLYGAKVMAEASFDVVPPAAKASP